jgi:hypothetical protein
MSLPKQTHPLFSAEIPSTKKTIRFRPFTAREEKILLIAKQSDEETDIMGAIKQVVNNCVVTEGFDVDKLTIFDLEMLFIKTRIMSVSNIATVSFKDNSDGKVYHFDVDLEKVKVIWPIDKPPTISLGEDIGLTLRWPLADLYTDMQLLESEGPEALEQLIAKCIQKIFKGDETFDPSTYTTEEVVEFVNDIASKPFEEIRKFFEDMPRLQYIIEYTNSKGEPRRIELSALTDFFQFR